MDFGVSNLSKNKIFLGFDWLKYHNPKVDWKEAKIEFSRCPGACHSTVDKPEDELEYHKWSEVEEGDKILAVHIGPEEMRYRTYQSKAGQLAEQAYVPKTSRDLRDKIPSYCLPYHKVFEKETFDELPPQ
ncbi:hypothetical protein AMATHDRAFT_156234, partial [Amanita thiersii Skay4041]